MNIKNLIAKLKEYPEDMEVMVLDGFNGGGHPRDINLGPVRQRISAADEKETADCEGRRGESVLVIGYGCY